VNNPPAAEIRAESDGGVAGKNDWPVAVSEQRRRVSKVHCRGRTEADVTEGSGGIWERLPYDWSDRKRVVLTTTDSNVWGGASGHTYTFTRRPNGTTDIDFVIVLEGENLKGRGSASC
jgi:hypothetical protein